ncbi:MAG: PAS domain-containing protein [Thermomonas sp.]
MPYRHAYEHIPAQVWTAAPDGMLNYVNAEAAAYMGMPAEDLHGTGWGNAVHPQDIVVAAPRWSHSISTGEPYEQLFRLRHGADQRYYWFIARANAVRDDEDRISHWVGVNTRIDGIALAQEVGRVAFEANSLSHAVFDQLPVAMIVLAGAGLKVQRVTAAARHFAAMSVVEQQPLLAAYPQLASLGESGELSEVMMSGEGRRINNLRIAVGDGKPMPFDLICEPLHDARGAVEGLTLAFLPA